MAYQLNRFSQRIPLTTKLQMLLAAVGALVAAAQALFGVMQGNALCFNDGCEVVEQLSRVPPLTVNSVGALFFLVVFLLLWWGGRGGTGWLTTARVLLLAAMAVEGVLIGFQHIVAGTFCSYCLFIFALIFLLNLLMGWYSLIAGLLVACASLLAFAFMQPIQGQHLPAGLQPLEKGTYGTLTRSRSDRELHFFFSSTCPHCEEVIATIDQSFTCSLDFNPIDELAVSPLASLVLQPGYSPAVNRDFLRALEVTDIPVLVVRSAEEIQLLKGTRRIVQYFDSNCRPQPSTPAGATSELSQTSSHGSALPFWPPNQSDETCTVDVDCEETPVATTSGNPAGQ
ncbi:MAG: hypothetical protein ACK5PS_00580 [Desulfopila sp.]